MTSLRPVKRFGYASNQVWDCDEMCTRLSPEEMALAEEYRCESFAIAVHACDWHEAASLLRSGDANLCDLTRGEARCISDELKDRALEIDCDEASCHWSVEPVTFIEGWDEGADTKFSPPLEVLVSDEDAEEMQRRLRGAL